MLQEKEETIRQAINGFKINHYMICKTLVEIRDQHLFKEADYGTITEYLNSKPFGFGRRHALKLMDVYEKFDKSAIMALGITKLIAISHITDKEERDEMAENSQTKKVVEVEAEVSKANKEEFSKRNERAYRRQDEDLEIESDSLKDKCIRQGNNILNDIDTEKRDLSYLRSRIERWVEFSDKFQDNQITGIKVAIESKKEELNDSKQFI